MKTGIIRNALLLIMCCIAFLPQFSRAGSVNVPGFKAPVVVPKVTPMQQSGGQSVSIPGFYGPAVAPPSRTQLPVLKNPSASIPGLSGVEQNSSQNQLIIHQNQPQAIIDWSSFDIGADASTHFDQKGNTNWTALNRIWNNKPSLIFGKLTADGKIYLINQNGILFGPGSKINVHSLVASALNISDDNFLKDVFINKNKVLLFEQEEGSDELAAVSNYGEIISTGGGSLFLIAPRVENYGLIDCPTGNVGLVAGSNVMLAQPDVNDISRSGYYVLITGSGSDVPSSGNAVNRDGGRLYADGGMVGMYGNTVDQWGVIRSTTAFKNNQGNVELRAARKVTTGENSVISLPVDASIDPETGKTVTVSDTFDIQPVVDIKGLHEWNADNTTITDLTPVTRIELKGTIEAPAGIVTLYANERVYLETGSLIDVSGVVAELPAPVIEDFTLNSVELRDAYGQKGGVLQGESITTTLTAGSAIGDLSQLILSQDRTAIERSIGGARRTIVDETTGVVTYDNPQTGWINISAADGDIIIKQGSTLDFSGGSIQYDSGLADTTKLLAGTRIYDISSAPLAIRYDKVIGQYTKTYEKFGIREEYAGLYYGGASPLKTYVGGYTKGGDAGKLTLSAATIVLDGAINGRVTNGVFQNTWTMRGDYTGESAAGDYDVAIALSERCGLEVPRAGTLEIGDKENQTDIERYTTEISVLPEITPRTSLMSDTSLQGDITLLSAELLNAANLGTLTLNAALTVSIAPEAVIRLQPGGSFEARGRRIHHEGEIIVPGGAISLLTEQNLTSEKDRAGYDNDPENIIALQEKIILGSESRLDVSGERIDNSLARINGITSDGFSHTTGGSIAVQDKTDLGQGVFIETGAVVDVSGGYVISEHSEVSGGHAGLLDIQGKNIVLDGDLRGYALSDENGNILGGSVTLRSTDIHVAPEVSGIGDVLVLKGDRFKDTGFTQIALYSFNDIVIEPNTTIETSLVRLRNPVSSMKPEIADGDFANGSSIPGRPELIRLDDSMAFRAGPSSFTAVAGREFESSGGSESKFTGNLRQVDTNSEATVMVSRGAVVNTFPSVSAVTRIAEDVVMNPSPVKTGITLKGPNVDVEGTLESFGGNIMLDATKHDLKITPTARVLANGYNRPDPASTPKDYDINYLPVAGGNVALSAYADLTLADGSLIDISGSDDVENSIQSSDGNMFTFKEAGDPGSLSLSFGNSLTWSGMVQVKNSTTQMDGIQGGALTINKTASGQSEPGLKISTGDIQRYTNAGFDDITLKNFKSVQFIGTIDTVEIGRKLTLDAPEIRGSGNDVTLSAPWIVLTNRTAPVPESAGTSGGSLTLSGEWIDVIGATQFTGFNDVTLKAGRDIRLSEALYDNNVISGRLDATGNLIMDADRIYPSGFYSYQGGSNTLHSGVYSDFIVEADKKVVIQHTDAYGNAITWHSSAPIYSAGGTLTIEGKEGIEVSTGGFLAAPMGAIALSAPGQRIYLADGSVITTTDAGEIAVNYGLIDESNIWLTDDKVSIQNAVPLVADDLPQKGVTLNADTTVMMEGAVVDVSGGGSIFAYKFLPGIEGSDDPLTKSGRYVVLRTTLFEMPGTAVYLQGGGGLSEGLYTLIPLDANHPENARYAFMPGAYIIEAQTGTTLPVSGQAAFSKDGYPLTVGYAAVADTSIRSTRPTIYSVRTTADVMTEGHYIKPDPLISGNAGFIDIQGESAIVNGVFRAAALDDYKGGSINLSGRNVSVLASAVPLPEGFGFATPLPDSLKDSLSVTASGLTGQGFREIDLGDPAVTENVSIKAGAVLEAPVISLNAKQMIAIESGAALHGVGQDGIGEINLNTPEGAALVESGALVHTSHAFNLNVGDPDIQGDLQLDNSAVTLKAENIYFGDSTDPQAEQSGLYITDSLWSRFSSCDDITLVSGSDLWFTGDFDLSIAGVLSIDAGGIAGVNAANVSLAAPFIQLSNTASVSAAAGIQNDSQITFTGDNIAVGGGDILFAGYSSVYLNSRSDMVLKGAGNIKTGGADLNITAARVTTASITGNGGSSDMQSTPITAADFSIDAGAGAVRISSSGGAPGTSSVPGGLLDINARRIELGTVMQIDAGTIKLTTKGVPGKDDDGIFLTQAGRILARGTDNAPGGRVMLATEHIDSSGALQSGAITLEDGSLIDVSAGEQGDAGIISLSAPGHGATINGTILGTAGNGGLGGSFFLDTAMIGDLAPLNGRMISGGFTEALDLRARNGNIDIGGDQTVTANNVKLTADSGEINVYEGGTIDASASPDAGIIELYAHNNLNVGGRVLAKGTTKGEEDVVLSSANGSVNLQSTGLIDVSGGGTGQGVVHLRALQQNGNDVQIHLDGAIEGASAVYVEAVRVYDNISTVDADHITAWQADTQAYMENAAAIESRLLSGMGLTGDQLHIMPGIEVRNSAGDITIDTDWNVSARDATTQQYMWRYGATYNTSYDDEGNVISAAIVDPGEPGVLTLRAAGNINVNNNLADHPTDRNSLITSALRDSWAFNLVAGADIDGADPLAVTKGTGDLIIADSALVYTESAPIRFASGNDTVIGSGMSAGYMINGDMKYSLASYDGLIEGRVVRDLRITGGAVQTATGNIDIAVGRDLQLNAKRAGIYNFLGSIRTTGQATATALHGEAPDLQQYWTYGGGGDITLEVGRHLGSFQNQWLTASDPAAWDYVTKQTITLPLQEGQSRPTELSYGLFSASFEEESATSGTPTAGLATMGGGNLVVRTGGDCLVQAGTFGAGDLSLFAGGDVRGRFLNRNGSGEINAMGNFGSADELQQIELFDSRMTVTAQGEIQIGAVLNPTLASNKNDAFKIAQRGDPFVNCTYTADTSISLQAGTDVMIAGRSPFYDNDGSRSIAETILPAAVNVEAGGDISLLSYFTLTSSPTGNLCLIAGGDIRGSAPITGDDQAHMIMMSDIAPEYWYGLFQIYDTAEEGAWIAHRTVNDNEVSNRHGYYKDADRQANARPIHAVLEGDTEEVTALKKKPVEIRAGKDIRNLKMYFSKKAEITAKGDIVNITYEGQNNNPDDVSKIRAGGDISMEYIRTFTSGGDIQNKLEGLIQSGPGVFLVQAGGSIDLGTLKDGIQAIGNGRYAQLGTENSTLLMVSGYTFSQDKTADEIAAFFTAIRTAGDEYAQLLADGKLDEGEQLLQQTREQVIEPFLGNPSGEGDINMTASQIGTSIGKSDIYIIANRDLNLGQTALPVSGRISKTTGITTGGGGAINIFANRDVNVNESRIMTFYGGDITVWSDAGNINAGRGSRTAVSASPPKVMDDGTKVFSPPAIGSGIRAVTFGENAPEPGDIHLFAPTGIIDAGEAEISGGRIVLAAQQVLNVQNISFATGSVGVPITTEGVSGIGTLSGAGTVAAQNSQLMSDASSIASTSAAQAARMIDDIMTKWLDVKVIEFSEETLEETKEE